MSVFVYFLVSISSLNFMNKRKNPIQFFKGLYFFLVSNKFYCKKMIAVLIF